MLVCTSHLIRWLLLIVLCKVGTGVHFTCNVNTEATLVVLHVAIP
jgi:hypothetical protein